MGLSKSKPSDRRGEEQKKGSPYSSAKSKDKLLEKRFQESRQASEETGKPLDSLLLATATAPHREPFASLEGTRNKPLPHAALWSNPKLHAQKEKLGPRPHTNDSLCMKCPERENSREKRSVAGWSQGLEWG
ncbi:spermatogenesis-associated protein 33 isoform X2 [Fukomys damarensis]|uniref:spermatogenesis-associated protein 33 isoform X2 n=1 Tax=Fukomys damarensis TaxID=885580 RepID=UPI00053F8AB3|nr:spermatogenesis-associated protein 33 isoform X2 [Fukomys damarensis]